MIKISLKLDVSLSKLVCRFVGLSAAAAAVYYLSSRKEKQSNVKVEEAFSINGKNEGNDRTVDESEVSEQTHDVNENSSESKSDARKNKNNSLQYNHEESQKLIFSDKDESLSVESQVLVKMPDTNATSPKEIKKTQLTLWSV